jgi:hypothetical protein
MQGYGVLNSLSEDSIKPTAEATRSINNLATRFRYLLKSLSPNFSNLHRDRMPIFDI